FLPEHWPDLEARFGTPDWPWMKQLGQGKAMLMLGQKEFRPVLDDCWNGERRIEAMDEHGIDVQVMSATPLLFAYGRPADQAREVARLFNSAAREICAHDPRRLKSLCQVPLQDTDAACAELDIAMAEGHIGVQIGNHVGDRNLDDAGIITFLHHCADVGAAVLIHPWDMMAQQRMPKYMMSWLVGMPAETQLSILSLILSGAFEKLPRSLRLCFAHGGGSFAFLLGRVDNAWRNRDIVRVDCPELPSSYTDRFYVDSAVFNEDALAMLIKVMGEDRVVLGSDYPFPLGEQVVGQMIREDQGLDASLRAKLLGTNAARFLNLEECMEEFA
ncbi:MAG: amidohydrolase family protein, partial [Sphingobium sp.]